MVTVGGRIQVLDQCSVDEQILPSWIVRVSLFDMVIQVLYTLHKHYWVNFEWREKQNLCVYVYMRESTDKPTTFYIKQLVSYDIMNSSQGSLICCVGISPKCL